MGIKGSSLGGAIKLGQGVYLPEAGSLIDYDGQKYLQSGMIVDISTYPSFPSKLRPLAFFDFITKDPNFGSNAINAVDIDEELIVAGGTGGLLTVSFNAGDNFEVKDIGFGSSSVRCVKISGDTVIAAGDGGKVAISKDRAQSFEFKDIGMGSSNILSLDISGLLVIMGATGSRTYKSTDGGDTFTLVAMGGSQNVNGVAIIGSVVIVAQSSNVIRRSVDGGDSYTVVPSPITGSTQNLNCVATSGQQVAIGGDNGNLFFSDNIGSQFISVTSGFGSSAILSIKMDGNKALIAGVGGNLKRATDKFSSIQDVSSNFSSTTIIRSVSISGSSAVLSGDSGELSLSTSEYIGFETYTPNLYMRIA